MHRINRWLNTAIKRITPRLVIAYIIVPFVLVITTCHVHGFFTHATFASSGVRKFLLFLALTALILIAIRLTERIEKPGKRHDPQRQA